MCVCVCVCNCVQSISDGTSMVDVVRTFQPTVLLGLAAQPGGLFTEEIVSSMNAYCDAPIVMPMVRRQQTATLAISLSLSLSLSLPVCVCVCVVMRCAHYCS